MWNEGACLRVERDPRETGQGEIPGTRAHRVGVDTGIARRTSSLRAEPYSSKRAWSFRAHPLMST